MTSSSDLHPDLVKARWIPALSVGPWLSWLARKGSPRPVPPPDGVIVEERTVPGPEGAPPVSLRIIRPAQSSGPMPALFWIHGGGLLFGNPIQDDRSNTDFVLELGITVVSVRYRFAPDHPAPAAVEDVYAGVMGFVSIASEFNIDTQRIAVGGASAGGGLAAAVNLLLHDRGTFRPAFQLLVYPMIDDRTAARKDLDKLYVKMWTPSSNRYAWTAYLGHEPGVDGVSPYSAAARREDLSGLPPAWIGVGSLDLFHDEDREYARRLNEAGVPCELKIVPGAFHGFDAVMHTTPVSRMFWEEQARVLRAALFT